MNCSEQVPEYLCNMLMLLFTGSSNGFQWDASSCLSGWGFCRLTVTPMFKTKRAYPSIRLETSHQAGSKYPPSISANFNDAPSQNLFQRPSQRLPLGPPLLVNALLCLQITQGRSTPKVAVGENCPMAASWLK